MEQLWQAIGLTLFFTITSITIVGLLMWLLYRHFNRYLPKEEESL